MDAKQFLQEFEHIASAPGGVQRLREMVLHLAVSGKLVENSNGEDVDTLLDKAEQIRLDYIEQLSLRKSKRLPELTENNYPFAIPQHWRWVRLENIAKYIQRGKSPKYAKQSSTRVVSQKCIQWSGFSLDKSRFIAEESLGKYGAERFLVKDDLLWNSTGTGTVGRVNVFDLSEGKSTVADSHVTVIRLSNCHAKYIWCVLSSPWVQSRMVPGHEDALISGTTNQVELNTTSVRGLPVPIPPLEEQKRIIAKVNELMALCDKLEAQHKEREKLCQLTRKTLIERLKDSISNISFQKSWKNIAISLQELIISGHDIVDIKDMICVLAVRGQLSIPSNSLPNIEEIEALTTELFNEYKDKKLIKNRKPASINKPLPGYFPRTWKQLPLDKVAVVMGGITKGRKLNNKSKIECKYLRVANVQRGFFDLNELKSITIYEDEYDKYKLEQDDLLITEGGDWDKVGRTAIWKKQIPKCLHQNHVFKVRVPSSQLLNKWVELVFNSPIGRDYFAHASKQTTNLASINMTQLRSFPLPIPHLEEQKRIVAKVNQLMAICEKLEEQLTSKTGLADKLAIACVEAITGTKIQEQETMKAPKTELVSKLVSGTAPASKDKAPLASLLTRKGGEMTAKDLWNQSGLEKIDGFYQQLKTEMANGWIVEPEKAYVRRLEEAK